MKQPVRFSPEVEDVRPDEDGTIRELEEQFRYILDTTSRNYGHAVRSVHAKAHGIARGILRVHADLPPELAQGLFAAPGEHEAVWRISTNAGDILDDSIALPRGLALKVFGVEGDRLPGSEGDTTQDFIMVNGPVFAAPDAEHFLRTLKVTASTTDKAEGAKKAISKVFRAVEAGLEAVGLESATISQLGGAPQVHPLGETYFSQTPFRYGDHIAKFALFPVSPALTELTGDTVSTADRPDALREVVNEVMAVQGGSWELRVQLNRDLAAMPVEDPTVEWKQDDSSFLTVATLTMAPQSTWNHDTAPQLDDALSFSIWHGIAAHRPLGNVNRARRDPYRMSADYRRRFNGCPLHEPASLGAMA